MVSTHVQHQAVLRLIVAVELLAIGAVRTYFGAHGAQTSRADPGSRAEPRWLTMILGSIAVLHFGAILAYLAYPPLLL